MNAYIQQQNAIRENTAKSASWIAYAQNWLSAPLRSVRLTYFSGVDATYNPSGTANVNYIDYYESENQMMRVYFRWDANDNLLEQRNYPFA